MYNYVAIKSNQNEFNANKTFTFTVKPMYMSFGATALRPREEGGRIKVTDEIIWINVLPPDGVPRRYAAYANESLMTVLERNQTAGHFPDCAGGDPEHTFASH